MPELRPRPLCRPQGPGGLSAQPLQAPGRPDRRHRVPLDQIAADHVVPGALPAEPAQGRDELGRAGAAAGHAPADRLAAQAQADGGDGGARGGEAQAPGPGRGRRRLSGRAARGRQRGRGAAARRARGRGRDDRRAQAQAAQATVVKGFRKKEIAALAKRDLAAASNVVTDGLSCWAAVERAGCTHVAMVTGSGPQAAKWVPSTLRRP